MKSKAKSYEELRAYIETLPLIDCHDHTHQAGPKYCDAMESLMIHYMAADMISAGSEADYRIRGPGEFFGTRQSGLPELRLADIFNDGDILAEAREDAFRLVAEDPQLARRQYALLRKRIAEVFAGRLDLGGIA